MLPLNPLNGPSVTLTSSPSFVRNVDVLFRIRHVIDHTQDAVDLILTHRQGFSSFLCTQEIQSHL